MFLEALLWILCIYFGHFYELMILNEVYSLFQVHDEENQEKDEEMIKNEDLCMYGRIPDK